MPETTCPAKLATDQATVVRCGKPDGHPGEHCNLPWDRPREYVHWWDDNHTDAIAPGEAEQLIDATITELDALDKQTMPRAVAENARALALQAQHRGGNRVLIKAVDVIYLADLVLAREGK